ncbi:twin-arginine translocase subunit TatC, partial [Gammaproteobacteria bacterium]|nr:twin-arginine translocase subunit TatC [Gammaproteobacteria bacterium]
LTDHLLELRNRLLIVISTVAICALLLTPFANNIYNFLALPLLNVLPEGSSMIAVDVASPFLAPFKLILLLSIAITFPVSIYNFWAFVAPGLYKNEKKFVIPILISSTLLFYLGIVFAYYIVFPLIFSFFTSIAPEGVQIATDISSFLNFVIKIFFAFGLAFEVPIITLIVIIFKISTVESLSKKRPYIIVIAFILGMVLTPPDIISQILLAIPIWLLFEIGLFLAYLITRNKAKSKRL